MLHTLNRTQFLPLDLEKARGFFSDPGNLYRITPDWLYFRITCQSPEPMYAGQIMTYTVQPLPGLKTSWITEISHVEKPRFFVDEQRLGPYAFWHHQHRFQEEDGASVCRTWSATLCPWGGSVTSSTGSWSGNCLKPFSTNNSNTGRTNGINPSCLALDMSGEALVITQSHLTNFLP